jgi:integral membrane protein (TIGR01906 family)
MPGFPPDTYGFSPAERLHWAEAAWDYELNSPAVRSLAVLTFPDGSPLYNAREVSHMQDVKNVVGPGLAAGFAVCFVVLGIGLWARWGGWWAEYLRGIRRGGWLTLGLVALIGVFAATSFWTFFTDFHEMFFTGTSWQFEYSDTLIRLFPLRLWQDVFLFIGLLDAAAGLALGIAVKPKAK